MKKLLSLLLTGLLLNLTVINFAYAASPVNDDKETKFINKLKEAIYKIGTGEKSSVEIELKDKTKLKGFIKEYKDNGFTIVDKKTGVATIVLYPQVKQIKGSNLSTGEKVLIGVGVGVGVLLLVVIISIRDIL